VDHHRRAAAAFCEGFTAEIAWQRRDHLAHMAGARRELVTVERRPKEILNALAEGYRAEAWTAELLTLDTRKAALTIALAEPPMPASTRRWPRFSGRRQRRSPPV
jgi:hypothetical protein